MNIYRGDNKWAWLSRTSWVFILVICITVATLLVSANCFTHTDLEGIFLVASHVCITHEEQCVRVGSGRARSYKVQFDFGFLLQR